MKKTLLFILCCVLMFGFYSCGTSKIEENRDMQKIAAEKNIMPQQEENVLTDTGNNVGIGGGIQLPNPYFNFDTLEEAEEMAGFTITLPEKEDLPDWIIKTDYRATKSNLIEIIYPGDENYKREIRLRKAMSDMEDISGDYNSYEKESLIEINGKKITVRINNDKIYGAIWRNGDFAYSIGISDGVSSENLEKLISIIN